MCFEVVPLRSPPKGTRKTGHGTVVTCRSFAASHELDNRRSLGPMEPFATVSRATQRSEYANAPRPESSDRKDPPLGALLQDFPGTMDDPPHLHRRKRQPFTRQHFEEARASLSCFLPGRSVPNEMITVNAALHLLELVYYELGTSQLPRETLREIGDYFCHPRLFNTLFQAWRRVALRYTQEQRQMNGRRKGPLRPPQQGHGDVEDPLHLEQPYHGSTAGDEYVPIPGRILLQMMLRMSQYCPRFEYDISTVNVMLQVIIQQEPDPNMAPLIAEHVLQYVLRRKSRRLRMNVFTYSLLMNAWCASGLSKTPAKIDYYRQQMKLHRIKPTIVLYHGWMRYWGQRGAIDQIQQLVKEMRENDVAMDIPCTSLLIYGYAQQPDYLPQAEVHFEAMLLSLDGAAVDPRSVDAIQKSAMYLLDALRRNLTAGSVANTLSRAERVLQLLEQRHLLDDSGGGGAKLRGVLMDIYGRSGHLPEAQALFQNMGPRITAVQYGSFMWALGKAQRPAKAEQVLKDMLQDERVVPDIAAFNILINAWAESSAPDAIERAFRVLQWIQENPRCVAAGIAPNEITYNSLLKCLASSKDSAAQAEAVLNEMEGCIQDRQLKPDAISYTMAIQACLKANDTSRAEALLQRMEKSDTPPNTITYNILLHYCSQLATPASAERGAQLLEYMSELGHPAAAPDVRSYHLVMIAWAQSQHPQASQRLWALYKSLLKPPLKEALGPVNMECYITLLNYFSKSKSVADLQRCMTLLYAMEQSELSTVQPDFWHYDVTLSLALDMVQLEMAAQVLRMSVEASLRQKGRKPRGFMFHRLVTECIRYGDLQVATRCLLGMKELMDLHQRYFGLDLSTVQELIRAWGRSGYPDTVEHVQKLDLAFFSNHPYIT
jgi:pentatricopeptide repeat protein